MFLFDVSKIKSKCALPRVELPHKESNLQKNTLRELKNVFSLVYKLYNAEELDRACFDRLSLVEQRILLFLLKKLFPVKTPQKKLSFEDIEVLQNLPSKKRNEEKIKQIWKRFLRKIYEDYKSEFVKSNAKGSKRSKACDKWREFYAHIFADLVKEQGSKYSFDLVMDICTEQTVRLVNSKRPRQLTRANNWSSLSKISAMKKIPASFRYLVSQSALYSDKFREFLSKDNKEGILQLMKTIIRTKLLNLFNQWEDKLLKLGQQQFLELVEFQIRNKKFKLPWLLSNVRDSIEYCVKDIDNEKLTKKFESIRQNHYSFKAEPVLKLE